MMPVAYRYQSNTLARSISASGTPDSIHIFLYISRKVKVKHVRNIFNVDWLHQSQEEFVQLQSLSLLTLIFYLLGLHHRESPLAINIPQS